MKTATNHHAFKLKAQASMRRTGFLMGLVVAMLAVLTAFNWKVPLQQFDNRTALTLTEIDDDMIPITITKVEVPKPKAVKLRSTAVQPIEPKAISKVSSKIEAVKHAVSTSPFDLPDLPGFLEEVFTEDNEARLFVSEFPSFKGCEYLLTDEERRACTDYEILRFIRDEMVYPRQAIERGIQGLVMVEFVVERDGSLNEFKILKGVKESKALENEALRLVKRFPEFTPGMHEGKKVRVKFNIPIHFKLM